MWSNRGNNLLLSLLQHRYPALCSEDAVAAVTSQLYTPGAVSCADSDAAELETRLAGVSDVGDSGLSEEMRARLLCYVASRILTTLNTTHCTPLPANKFQLPWSPGSNGSDFVKVDPEEEGNYESDQSS